MIVTGGMISSIAKSHIGSKEWNLKSSSGSGTDKCHLFIEHIVDQAGGVVPKTWLGIGGPITADEWGDPKSGYLVDDKHWVKVSEPDEGDVISDGKHVGIITGFRTTTHAAPDKIIHDNWGFKASQSGKKLIVWRYKN